MQYPVKKITQTFAFTLCLLLMAAATPSWAQSRAGSRIASSNSGELLKLLSLLQAQGCIQDVPAPRLLSEPRFTKGLSNIIYFQLPDEQTLPFVADTVLSPFVITLVDDGTGSASLQFPRPVDLDNSASQTEIIAGLLSGARYAYSTALFLPVCKLDCAAVTDTTQLELHCSAYLDTVWSIQDNSAPDVQSVVIPQLAGSAVTGWTNQSTIRVEANLSDPAGIWQGYLYRRNCGETAWSSSVADTTYPGSSSETGFVFSDFSQLSMPQTLPDGCYEFRIEGKDATHTPESSFPNFQLAGNGGTPDPDADAHIRINIDTTPPGSVTLNCEQVLNSIELDWTASADPNSGVGLAGYRVYRDGKLLDSVPASQDNYTDTFPPSTPDSDFFYQVQPFDSLGNTQSLGGSSNCQFNVVSQVAMLPEPVYTAGTSNEVCWTGSPNIVTYTLFMAKNCDYANANEFVVNDTCFTFTDLEDGTDYCYWVRAVDEQQRVVFSDTVQSRQDATVPQVAVLDVLEKQILGERNWTTKREVEIKLTASDAAPGVIQTLEIFENGTLVLKDDLESLSSNLDVVLSYTIAADECEQLEISAQVRDAAGNLSAVMALTIRLDETPPDPLTSLNCAQLLGANGIQLDWTAVDDPGFCSGLAGYMILRNGAEIASIAPNAVRFEDVLPADTPSGQFTYAVQPFDSLGNIQTEGPVRTCDYIGTSTITIAPLPKFTQGLVNEICIQVSGSLESITLFLDENCDSIPDDSLQVLNPQSQVCHSFQSLSDGQEYCYWASGLDQQQRVVTSNTVRSFQDDTAPTIDRFELPGADTLNGQLWVYGKTVKLRIVAHDALPGEVLSFEIHENGQPMGSMSISDPTAQINRLISYDLITSIGQLSKVELAIQVVDGANNVSELRAISVNVQEALPPMFAFPNPFNPMQGNVTIRLDDPSETEVKVFDFFGNLVQTLTQKANSRDFIWDGRNGAGEIVASGGYVCIGTRTKARFKIGVMKQRF